MNDDLDDRLREALRPVDPGERFAQAVLSKVAEERISRRSPMALRQPMALRWAAAVGAIALGTLAVYGWQARREQGLEARRELLEALQVTGEKLDVAYRAVNDPMRDPGA
jgi:hypothetical protein